MKDLDDFHAFESTTSDEEGSPGSGCLGRGVIWAVVILALIGWIITLFK